MSVIMLKEISKVYGEGEYKTEALKHINLAVEKGEMISIMGPSGCGKSTLLNILGCIDTYTEGEFYLNDKRINNSEINSLSKIRNEEIAFIFQNFALIKDYTIWENVELPLRFKKINKRDKKQIIEKYLSYLGLLEIKSKTVDKISGGQQQRVAIARALVQESNVILADEPTGALDQKNGHNIMNIFKDLNMNYGKTIIIVTHDLNVAKYSDKIVHLKDGEIESFTILNDKKQSVVL